MPPSQLVHIGDRPDLALGHAAFPRHRAPYARQVVIFTSDEGMPAAAAGDDGLQAVFAGLAARLCAALEARSGSTARP